MQKRVLEDLLGHEWFGSTHSRAHPAYLRWVLCNRILQSGGRIDKALLFQWLELVLDNCSLVNATGGNLGHFVLGTIGNYGDTLVQNRIRSVIRKPRQFQDLLVELNFAAWHIVRGSQVQASEAEGHPDFEIFVPCPAVHLAADCKRVQAGTSGERFGKIVNKANKQIKTLGAPCHGLLVVDVAARIPQLSGLGDSDPPEIDRVVDLLQRSMRTHNTAVSAALITWRTLILTPMKDGSGRTLCVFQQYSRIVRHLNPLFALPDDDSFLKFGNSVILYLGGRSG